MRILGHGQRHGVHSRRRVVPRVASPRAERYVARGCFEEHVPIRGVRRPDAENRVIGRAGPLRQQTNFQCQRRPGVRTKTIRQAVGYAARKVECGTGYRDGARAQSREVVPVAGQVMPCCQVRAVGNAALTLILARVPERLEAACLVSPERVICCNEVGKQLIQWSTRRPSRRCLHRRNKMRWCTACQRTE